MGDRRGAPVGSVFRQERGSVWGRESLVGISGARDPRICDFARPPGIGVLGAEPFCVWLEDGGPAFLGARVGWRRGDHDPDGVGALLCRSRHCPSRNELDPQRFGASDAPVLLSPFSAKKRVILKSAESVFIARGDVKRESGSVRGTVAEGRLPA